MFATAFLYISLFILFGFAWLQSKRDVMSPSVLLCVSFVLGTTLYLLGSKRTTIDELTFPTVMLILSSILLFIVVEGITRFFIKGTHHYSDKQTYSAFQVPENFKLELKNSYLVILIILMLITAFIQVAVIRDYSGSGSLASMMSVYRTDSLMADAPKNVFVDIFSRVVYGITPLFLFSLFYKKYVCNEKFKNIVLLAICAILYVVSIFLISGARGRVFSFLFQAIASIILCMKFGNKRIGRERTYKGGRNWLKTVVLVAIIGVPLFYYGGVFAGKDYTQVTPFQSVSNYFSYGLIRLNLIVKEGFTASENFGQWSFPGIYSLLEKFGMEYKNYDIFPFYGMFGNTVTIFGRWYVDFGVIGVYVMTAVVSLLYSTIFYKLKFSKSSRIAFMYSLIYIFLIGNILMASYDDWVRNLTAINTIVQIVVLIISGRYVYGKVTARKARLNNEGVATVNRQLNI